MISPKRPSSEHGRRGPVCAMTTCSEWLTVVGSRLAFNELRRRRRRPWSRLVAASSVEATATEDPELWAALGELRADERTALVLHVLCGYTHTEIGSQLGVAPGTVGSWISRGKARLRTTLTSEASHE